jgi:hypothetical protein
LIELLGERPHGNYPISSHDVAKIKEIQANGSVTKTAETQVVDATVDETPESNSTIDDSSESHDSDESKIK